MKQSLWPYLDFVRLKWYRKINRKLVPSPNEINVGVRQLLSQLLFEMKATIKSVHLIINGVRSIFSHFFFSAKEICPIELP